MAREDRTGALEVMSRSMEIPGKSDLRTRVRELVRAIPPEQRRTFSEQLCAGLRQQPAWQSATSILLFAPLAGEPDVTPLMDERSSRLTAFPRFNSSTGAYEACSLRALAELIPGRFGVLEPDAGCPVVPLNQLDLVLVPGLAFDLAGRRLGRGKGFYDRLLAQVRGHKSGVAFEAQIVPEVPEEPHDVRVNSILTPTCWRSCPRVD